MCDDLLLVSTCSYGVSLQMANKDCGALYIETVNLLE